MGFFTFIATYWYLIVAAIAIIAVASIKIYIWIKTPGKDQLNKIQESEIRHNKNVLNEKEKCEKKANDNQEKLMKKYVTFYWSRKDREEKKKINFYILMKNMKKKIIDLKK